MEFETKPILRLMHKDFFFFFFLVIRCTGYDFGPIEPWALARTFSRIKTGPEPHSKPISFRTHDRQAHTGQL